MTALLAIVQVELELVGLSAVFLTPIALIQAVAGRWMGVSAYARAASWGAVFLLVGYLAIRVAFS